ncbi:MAG: type III-A CRISPR-associated protein Cas10/Csm1 [Fusobacteriaceae bacterium]
MLELKNNFERVTLGGLLHDIGKLFNRSNRYRGNGEKGDHPFLSSWFLDYLVENKIMDSDEYLREIVQKHHESQYFPADTNVSSIKDLNLKKLALIVARADNYSSMERHGDTKQRNFKAVALNSIFSRIDIGKGKAPVTSYYLREFQKEHIFSKNHESNSQEEIDEIIEKLLIDVREIKTDNFEVLYLNLLEIIKKYTWTLPSDTQKEICDLSLYDHLKTTSAIATASYNYHTEINTSLEKTTQVSITRGKEEPHFLLIGGDISGIQKYIYSLASTENAAKRLRARSFFIKILTELASVRIIKELNLTVSNIVISNGGKFYIIAQNTEATLLKLFKLKNSINRELYHEYEGELFLNLECTDIKGEELGLKFSEKFDEINDKLEIGKSKKFSKDILENPIIENESYGAGDKVEICPICRKFLKSSIEKSCFKCSSDEIWGTNLHKMDRLAIYDEVCIDSNRINLFGLSAQLIKKDETILGNPKLVINFSDFKSSDIPTITGFYGGYIPTKNNEIMTFEEIAKESVSKNLGVLKGDIDDLGIIFSMGLKIDDIDNENLIQDVTSISRVATLSRMIDLFFAYWLPKTLKEKKEIFGSQYVVYSGGDDFMIVGPWDKLLQCSNFIKNEFSRFVGYNPNFTISMGLSITKDKDPIYMSSQWAKNLETLVKESGKDGIAIFDTYIPWKNYKEVFEFGDFLIELRTKHNISQSFIYRLLKYTSMAENYFKNKKSEDLMYLSKFEYDISRNIIPKLNEKEKKEILNRLIKYFGQEGFVDTKNREFLSKYMRVSINYAVRKLREGNDV